MLVQRDEAIKAYVMGMSTGEMYTLVCLFDEFKAYRWHSRNSLNELLTGYTPEEVIGSLAPDFDATMRFYKFSRHGYLESDDGYKRDTEMESLRPRMIGYLQGATNVNTGMPELDNLVNSYTSTVFHIKFSKVGR